MQQHIMIGPERPARRKIAPGPANTVDWLHTRTARMKLPVNTHTRQGHSKDVSNRPPPGGGGVADTLQARSCRDGTVVITRCLHGTYCNSSSRHKLPQQPLESNIHTNAGQCATVAKNAVCLRKCINHNTFQGREPGGVGACLHGTPAATAAAYIHTVIATAAAHTGYPSTICLLGLWKDHCCCLMMHLLLLW